MRARTVLVWLLIAGVVSAIPAAGQAQKKKRKDQPGVVVVQHILISFGRKLPDRKIERSKKEAEELAEKLFQRALAEEDFDALVKEYTNDSYPGIYRLTNIDAPLVPNSRKRLDMVVSFGDVAFNLEVDEVGLARYHGGNSPYGWHVIKRLE
jgi:hypothetical protein